MPVYEYRCKSCHKKFSLLRNVSERDLLPDCPGCGAPGAEAVISSFRPYKSHTEILDRLDRQFRNIDMNDPGSMKAAVKEMGGYIRDEASSGEEYNNMGRMLDKAEKEINDHAEHHNK
ncbi:MAG: zinc ribbon domain-containing protein [Abditibacteriota bacterium]|nr:zinc ribbon domain-containing protein [Abditibacteriota bacterium]